MAIGENLKKICKKKGLTLKELAKLSGVSVKTIYSITANDLSNISSLTMDKLCKALNVETLLYEDGFFMDYSNKINDLFELPGIRLEYNEEDADLYLIDTINNIYIEPSIKEIDSLRDTISVFSRFAVNDLFQEYIKNGKSKKLKK
ncbi:helix-turn-helix domain-containing protein [Veillonella parvula]|uniref:helix-turn-helix domain-containing protein n=1 Tax=Veillonella parvula TaxID=29466 RepID=UPI0024929E1C|nr:helix-turn-helix transcriptional regulator [Veillonella parvula]